MTAKRTTLPTSRLVPYIQARSKRSPATRKALKDSIAQYGVLQELLVIPDPERKGYYRIVSGNCRHENALELGIEELPVHILPEGLTEAECWRYAITMDSVRTNLNTWEIGDAISNLAIAEGITQAQAAATVKGISPATASKITTANTLPDDVKHLFTVHKVGLSLAYLLASKETDPDKQRVYAKRIVDEKLTREQFLKLIKGIKPEEKKKLKLLFCEDSVVLNIRCDAGIDYKGLFKAIDAVKKHLTALQNHGIPVKLLPQL